MKKQSLNLIRLIEILNNGAFHSGTQLGEQLNISRAGIWKIIKHLQEEGIEIQSVKGKGYQLQSPLILIRKENIASAIDTDCDLHIFESIDSTNAYLKTHDSKKKYHICIAEKQTAGKGRFGRPWTSPFGKNIYCSIKYVIQKDVSEISGLSLAVGLAVIQAIEKLTIPSGLQIKWPNDIFFKGVKLAGISMDVRAESNALTEVILGIGINTNMLDDKSHIGRDWSSLQKIKGVYIDRNKVIVHLLQTIIHTIEAFHTLGLTTYIERYNQYDYLKDKHITLTSGKFQYSGISLGINENGHLKVQLDNGETRHFSSGDTSFSKRP
jgi:BirA family transcriptional regulator, biotin operon repressor / biotin---[acetyl-CoA-carboxylase] ligase